MLSNEKRMATIAEIEWLKSEVQRLKELVDRAPVRPDTSDYSGLLEDIEAREALAAREGL